MLDYVRRERWWAVGLVVLGLVATVVVLMLIDGTPRGDPRWQQHISACTTVDAEDCIALFAR